MYKSFFKRFIDAVLAIIGLILLSPVFIMVMVTLWVVNNGKPFFFQPRPGLNEKVFSIVKFKTMNDKTDELGRLLPDYLRLTAAGRFVRKTSLDEIPQLINVLRGEMSLIGPRPLRVEYLPLYNEEQKLRHSVRPGITGWAQINGRNSISWSQKFEYDIWYVNNVSLAVDIRIIAQTIINVLKSKDINADANLTMEKFNGSN